MSYNTVSDFKARAIPSGSYNHIPDSTIQTYLDGAASEIDAHLRRYHSLPLVTGSYASELASIYDAEAVMTSWRLYLFAGTKGDIDNEPDQVLADRYVEIMDPENGFLSRLSEGKLIFPSAADQTPNKREGRTKFYGSKGKSYKQYNSDGEEIIGY